MAESYESDPIEWVLEQLPCSHLDLHTLWWSDPTMLDRHLGGMRDAGLIAIAGGYWYRRALPSTG